ncbi:LOW QUALITY PROTEIN: AP-4 complex subunit mu-1-like [Lethenteron reissneri]|uniref:LOW QUALITY PROTEIN: AP-4 complex subunit mu-1-like n=1 Tax=Lethenteron reissneri TaxID=7753 RepID=UPI002AB63C0B|nr:LOW QUALITY PROTEIN: AP-4 complex subunit mu-1-like [Lethenteron reissneri]
MLSQAFVLSSRGDTLLYRDYVGNGHADNLYERMCPLNESEQPIVKVHNGLCYVHTRHNGLYFGLTCKPQASPFILIQFLNRFAAIVKDYCGSVSEEAIRKNLPLLYELLEEILDFGVVQTTRLDVLRNYVQSEAVNTQPSSLFDMSAIGLFGADTQQKTLVPASASIRSLSHQSKTNEIFVDVLERLTVLIGANGNVVQAELNGDINLKSFVNGCSEIFMTFNHDLAIGSSQNRGYGGAVRLDECRFHANVNVTDFETKRAIRVSPGPGEMTVMQYTVLDDFPTPLPFRLFPTVEVQPERSRLLVCLKLRCDLSPRSHATNMMVRLPIPKSAISLSRDVSSPDQTATLEPDSSSVVWNVPRITGGSQLSAIFRLEVPGLRPSARLEVGPVALTFDLPSLAMSGLRIGCLRPTLGGRGGAALSGEPPKRWLRYSTSSGSYVVRI